MKKLLNDHRHVVREMLEGLVDFAPAQALLADENVVVRADLPPPSERKVAVISGGGSGHEPAHAGYVGAGMLTAAVAGDVFTSPSVDAVLAAIRAAAGPAGAVLVVKNYTGDRLNFGLAAELAGLEGIPTEIVVVADDVALSETVVPEMWRGIAGTVLVHKIAGAAAARGEPVETVAQLAREAAAHLGTMGVALGPCTVPGATSAGFALGRDEMELGLGIHGEKGVRRAPLASADAVTGILLETIVKDRGLAVGDRVAVLVNGLGATTLMELALIGRHALAELRRAGIAVERAWSGNFLTALEMPGCSVSLLRLDESRLALLDAPAEAPAWPGGGRIGASRNTLAAPAAGTAHQEAPAPGPLAETLERRALAAADALDRAEEELAELDRQAGDGDLGASMARGAAAIRALPAGAWAAPAGALIAVGDALRRAIAGSSGPFYATALLRAGRYLAQTPEPAQEDWVAAFEAGVGAVTDLGGAGEGDRTMVDALLPAARAFRAASEGGADLGDAWIAAVAAAEEGVAATAQMRPARGRAAYLGERALGVPDGGARAVAIWMRALGMPEG